MFHCPAQSDKIGPKKNGAYQEPIIFLPGWGFDGRVIELIQPALPWIYPATPLEPAALTEKLLFFLHERRIDRISLIGWSMGALQALDFARAYPDKVSTLYLISMRQKWPAEEIDLMQTELLQDHRKCLTTFYRKCFLGHRTAYKHFSSSLQPDYLENTNLDCLQQGLAYLREAQCLPAPGIKTHLIHGSNDIIVPLEQMARIPEATVEIVEQTGHLPFLSPACSFRKIQKKEAIRQKFSRAAATYDTHALVQKELAGMLADRLSMEQGFMPVDKILEIGCGTGSYTRELADIFPQAEILALDFSQEMINAACLKLKGFRRIKYLCEDGERYLTHAGHQKDMPFDLVTSNATLQWFTDLSQSFTSIARLLRPGGLLLCSIFGPKTLQELSHGLSSIFDRKIALAATGFPSKEKLHHNMTDLFSSIAIDEIFIRKQYSSLNELLMQIKKSGTIGWRDGQPLVFTRSRLTRLRQWFEKRAGGCQVTYHIFFLKCKK